jgi:hypothetical protein
MKGRQSKTLTAKKKTLHLLVNLGCTGYPVAPDIRSDIDYPVDIRYPVN